MKLLLAFQGVEEINAAQEALLHRAARSAALTEGIQVPCYVEVLLCDEPCIQGYNHAQRGKDAPTDVLSFPTVNYPTGKTAGAAEPLLLQEWDTPQSACFLGEVIISLPTAMAQAKAYGHAFERELCYLLVHGLLHLFGYDHQLKEEKRVMRQQEEMILQHMALSEEQQKALLQQARLAMQQAYVPYSGYPVGVCLLGADGRMYSGCNVENASYGLTNCGERTAIFKAVSEGCREFKAIAIAAKGFPPWPCGACRQVLSEFCADLPVLITWDDDKVERSTLQALLPHSFSPANGVTPHVMKGKE